MTLGDIKLPTSGGKRVGRAWYVHRVGLRALHGAKSVVDQALEASGIDVEQFNVVKVEVDPARRVSLLLYEDFDEAPFPALLESRSVDLATEKVTFRSYRNSANPPILHRKELLLPPDDQRRERFADLTKELEARGLFEEAKGIGFKKQWEERLAAHRIEIRDHQVIEKADESDGERGGKAAPAATARPAHVERHKTAISRGQLSAPMQALARHGLLDGERSVLDYGCGRGDDLAVLEAAGIPASGWDPHYRPDGALEEADLVNLGFVVNVIESPEERERTVADAFAHARQCLAVAVMSAGRADTTELEPYGDGVLSKRGTFQKYFTQEELRALLERATGEEAVAVAPGLFFVFRNEVEEQKFLTERSRGSRDISQLLGIAPPKESKEQEAPPTRDQALLEEHRELIDALWRRALELGRLPAMDELEEAVATEIEQVFGSLKKATRLAHHAHDPETLEQTKAARTEDLRVYFALNRFNKRARYGELPEALRRDVKAFFGAHNRAEAAGRDLLFRLGDPDTLTAAAREAANAGHGHLFTDREGDPHALQLHAALIPRLPAALRAYVGCAEKLYGDITEETVDLVKIHLHSGKLTVLRCDDFHGKAVPKVVERVKIKMRDPDMDFFDHTDELDAPRLTMKSRYMAADQDGYDRQKTFDDQLAALHLFDLRAHGPSSLELANALKSAGYKIDNFSLKLC